jgi:Cdc6-like AAA superfamily ATPase
LSGDRPKLIYIKTPAPDRQPRLRELIGRIQGDDVSYRTFGASEELRTLVADDLAVLLTERFAAAAEAPAEPRAAPFPPLPRPATRLIGRDTDVARVLELLAEPDVRMVTIVGSGGIGKSRLALAVAEGAKERYPDGIVYVDLASLREPSLVLPTIAKALGIEETGANVEARLQDRLAAMRMLMILDNMEQLADAAGDLSDLLGSTEAVQLLVTSRRILNIRYRADNQSGRPSRHPGSDRRAGGPEPGASFG